MTPAGTATVLWRLTQAGEATLQVNDFQPGGSLSGIEGLPLKSSDHPTFPAIAGNRKGDLIASWSGTSSTVSLIRASIRGAGGVFSAPSGISDSSNEALHSAAAIDEGGSGIAVWTRPVSGHRLVEVAGYDAVPPSLADVSIPPSGTVGSPVQFAATPHDDWPIGPAGFDFGDGTAAERQHRRPHLLEARHLPGDRVGAGRGRDGDREHGRDHDRRPQQVQDRRAEAEPQEGHRDG